MGASQDGYRGCMPKDRDQLTPDDPEDADHLIRHRGQGSGGTGLDELSPAELDEEPAPGDEPADDERPTS